MKRIMRYGIGAIFALIVFLCLFALSACSMASSEDYDFASHPSSAADSPSEPSSPDSSHGKNNGEASDERRGVPFSEIVYSRPNVAAIYPRIDEVTETIRTAKDTDDAIRQIHSLESSLQRVDTMYALVEIRSAKGVGSEELTAEKNYFAAVLPTYFEKAGGLVRAVKDSPFYGVFLQNEEVRAILNDLSGAVGYTDGVRLLRKREADLIAKYEALSPETVTVYYDGESGTYAEHLVFLNEKYGAGSDEYAAAFSGLLNRCAEAYKEERIDHYLDLLRVRRQIADAFSLGSYAAIAYRDVKRGSMHEYTPQGYERFLAVLRDSVLPVIGKLNEDFFNPYFATQKKPEFALNGRQLKTKLYGLLKERDADLLAAADFMIRCGLSDIAQDDGLRAQSGGIYYLSSCDEPFLFLTTTGDLTDYPALASAFGRYLEAYYNGGSGDPEDLTGFFGDSLGLIALLALENELAPEQFTYLKYTVLQDAMMALCRSALIGKFESLVYALSYDELDRDALARCYAEAAAKLGLPADAQNGLAEMVDLCTVGTPFRAQAKAMSTLYALVLFLRATSDLPGALSLYGELLDRGGERLSGKMNATLPIGEGSAEEMCALFNELYHYLTGAYYYQKAPDAAKNS